MSYIAMQDSKLANSLEKLAKRRNSSDKVLLILNKLMLKRYSGFDGTEKITVAELFNWELWPIILRIFGKGDEILCIYTHIGTVCYDYS